MTKIKIIILSATVILLLLGIGTTAFIFLQPKKTTNVQNITSSITSNQSNSISTQKPNFESSKKIVTNSERMDNPSDINQKKFTDGGTAPIKETDLNTYSRGRNESLIYSDDFVNANCESYILTLNSAQNCYLTFRKEVPEYEIPKIRALITPLETDETSESILNCKMLSIEQNPDKNALGCTTENLKLKNSGNYNMTLTIAGDTLNNSLEKNIEILTVAEFQQKYSDQGEN
jgi:hypothetical protein